MVEHLRILSRPDWVEPIAMFLKEQAIQSGACDAAQANRLVVCVTEAITNAIIHGNYELASELKEQGDAFKLALEERRDDPEYTSRKVDIRVEQKPDRTSWTISDQGQGFNVAKLMARLESDDPMEILASGRGITIMKAFVDEVAWKNGGRQITLSIFRQTAREQRTADRMKYNAAVKVILDDDREISAIGRDLSNTGLAFVGAQSIAPGTHIEVVLDAHCERASTVPGTIVRCQSIAPPYYDVALHFDQPIEADRFLSN